MGMGVGEENGVGMDARRDGNGADSGDGRGLGMGMVVGMGVGMGVGMVVRMGVEIGVGMGVGRVGMLKCMDCSEDGSGDASGRGEWGLYGW